MKSLKTVQSKTDPLARIILDENGRTGFTVKKEGKYFILRYSGYGLAMEPQKFTNLSNLKRFVIEALEFTRKSKCGE